MEENPKEKTEPTKKQIKDINSLELLKSITGYKSKVSSMIKLADGKILTVSYDNSIIVYNPQTLKIEIKKEDSHKALVYCALELENHNIITGGMNDIKLWKIENNQLTEIYKKNYRSENINNIIELRERLLAICITHVVTGHNTYSIQLYDLTKNEEKIELNLKEETKIFNERITFILQIKNGELVFGTEDYKVYFWDINKNEEISMIQLDGNNPNSNVNHKCERKIYEENNGIEINDNIIIVSSHRNINYIDCLKHSLTNSFKNNKEIFMSHLTKITDDIILLADKQGNLIEISIEKKKFVSKRNLFKDQISAIVIGDDGKIWIGSNEKKIKVLK